MPYPSLEELDCIYFRISESALMSVPDEEFISFFISNFKLDELQADALFAHFRLDIKPVLYEITSKQDLERRIYSVKISKRRLVKDSSQATNPNYNIYTDNKYTFNKLLKEFDGVVKEKKKKEKRNLFNKRSLEI